MLQKKSLEQREHGNAKQIIFSETPSDDTLQGFSIAINEDSESEDSTVSAAFAPYRVRPFEFAPTLYRVRPHTFRVYGGELEGANSIGGERGAIRQYRRWRKSPSSAVSSSQFESAQNIAKTVKKACEKLKCQRTAKARLSETTPFLK